MPRALEVVERNAGAQLALVEDLLDLSRVITGNLRLEVKPMLLGDAVETGVAGLDRLFPTPERTIDGGAETLSAVGVTDRVAASIVAVAHAILDGTLCLVPGRDPVAACRLLRSIDGIDDRMASWIAMRAMCCCGRRPGSPSPLLS